MPSPNQRVGEYVLDQQDRRRDVRRGLAGAPPRLDRPARRGQDPDRPAVPPQPPARGRGRSTGCTHPNIVRAIGFDPYADPPYLTMEYVPGTSLRPLIEQAVADDRRRGRDHAAGAGGAGVRARAGARPPRHQAGEHPRPRARARRRLRRRGRREGDGLRPGQGGDDGGGAGRSPIPRR